MKTLRTPGPWRYGRTLSHGLAVFGSPAVGSPEHVVAVADENDANARLIAAAPEMLEALKRALRPVPLDSSCPAELQKRTELMLAAIAKAEGTSSQASPGAANGGEDEG